MMSHHFPQERVGELEKLWKWIFVFLPYLFSRPFQKMNVRGLGLCVQLGLDQMGMMSHHFPSERVGELEKLWKWIFVFLPCLFSRPFQKMNVRGLGLWVQLG
jgi:hypothetical protein